MPREPVRRPAVAGLFYPERSEEVEAELDRLLEGARPERRARAVVVPHAGWTYSGRVAAEVYGRVRLPRVAIILGPNHTGLGPEGAIMTRGRWEWPGGSLPIAEEVGRALAAGTPGLEEDETAHVQEHAIEVQLPFLRRLRPDAAFVPITLMRTDLGFCEAIGRGVARVLAALPDPALVVCSTDLNHYEPQAVSNRKDRLAIDALLGLDPEGLARTVRDHRISMCGLGPALATLCALRELGHGAAELVRYQTSGDVSGDHRRVVGYAGIIVAYARGETAGTGIIG